MAADEQFPLAYLLFEKVPLSDPIYLPRSLNEQNVLEGIEIASSNPRNGPFLLYGGGGTGKSTLVAQMLHSKSNTSFFQLKCNIQAVVWLNCYRWNKGIYDSTTAKELEDELIFLTTKVSSRLRQDPSPQNLLERLDSLEKREKKRVLVVLDDCFHRSILETICRHHFDRTPCFAIARGLKEFEGVPLSGSHQLSPMSDSQILEILASLVGEDKLRSDQLGELAKLCYGSPVVAQLVAGYFANPNEDYQKLFKELVTSEFGKEDKSEVPEEAQVSFLFKRAMKRLTSEEQMCFFTLILFAPGEAVRISEISSLWNGKPIAKNFVEILLELAIVRRAIAKQRHDRFAEEHALLIHQILHENAVEFAKNLLGGANLSELRMKILTAAGLELLRERGLDEINCFVRLLCNSEIWNLRKFFKEVVRQLEVNFFERYNISEINPARARRYPTNAMLDCAKHRDPFLVAAVHRYDHKAIEKLKHQGDTALHVAACKGSKRVFEKLFKIWPGAAALQNKTGETPLHCAASNGKMDIAKLLVIHSPKLVKVQDSSGDTSMHKAVAGGWLELVEYMYDEWPGATKVESKRGLTPLSLAAFKGKSDVARFLVQRNPELVKLESRTGNTALLSAAAMGGLEIVQFLYKEWPEAAEKRTVHGEMAIQTAACLGKAAVVKFLAGKHPMLLKMKYRKGNTLTHEAVRGGCLDLVQFLIGEWPTSIDMQNDNGNTPLHEAVHYQQSDVAKFLTRQHPALLKVKNQHGCTALHEAAAMGGFDMFQCLYRQCPEAAELRNGEGQTPLYLAVLHGKDDVAKFLVREAPQLMKTQKSTLMHEAASKGCLKVAKFLYDTFPQAAEMGNEEGNTPLHLAAFFGRVDVANFLAHSNPSLVKLGNLSGDTAMHAAASIGCVELMDLLYSQCPEAAEMRNVEGKTPFDQAALQEKVEVIRFLLQKDPALGKMKDGKQSTLTQTPASVGCAGLVYRRLFRKSFRK